MLRVKSLALSRINFCAIICFVFSNLKVENAGDIGKGNI